jgi:hypothetical protein
MNHKLIISVFTLMIFPIVAPAQISSGGSFSLEKSVIAAGGGESAGVGFAVTGTTGQNAAGTASQTGNYSLIGGFWTADRLAPTAALVSISGKVTTLKGSGIRNVIVTLTDAEGNVRTTVTGTFGFYRFTNVEVGQTYVLQVYAKKYFFPNPAQVVSINDELTELNFTAED